MAGSNPYTQISPTCWVALTEAENAPSPDVQLTLIAKCLGVPPTTANVFEHGCMMTRTDSGTGTPAVYQNTGSSASPTWTLFSSGGGGSATSLVDGNGASAVTVGTTASAVNFLKVSNSATGAVSANAVGVVSAGSDAAVSLSVAPKGASAILTIGGPAQTGDIFIGDSSAAQTVKIAAGGSTPTVVIGGGATNGGSLTVLGLGTANGATDTINLATGNAVGSGKKVVNVATGAPAGGGNNQVTLGGGAGLASVTLNATVTQNELTNIITSESGANNAIAGGLNNASGSALVLAPGMQVSVLISHTLQAGANTFNYNGGGAVAIKSHFNVANNIGTAYAAGSLVTMAYDGSVWQDLSQ